MGNCCDNKKTKLKSNCCDDIQSFEYNCETDESLKVATGGTVITALTNLYNWLCGLTLQNCGEPGDNKAGVFKNRVGNVFNFKQIKGGEGVTISEPEECVIQIDVEASAESCIQWYKLQAIGEECEQLSEPAPLYTCQDLSANVGQFVVVAAYPLQCWQVQPFNTTVVITSSAADCTDCIVG